MTKKSQQKVVFNKNMLLTEVMEANPNSRAILMGFGMHCLGCPISQIETLEQAAVVHGVELEFLLEKLNELNDFDFSGTDNDFNFETEF